MKSAKLHTGSLTNHHTLRELNSRGPFDLAIVATPPNVCLDIAAELYSASNVLLLEKPVSLSRTDVEMFLSEFGTEKCFVGFQHLFSDDYQQFRSVHRDAGDLQRVDLRLSWFRSKKYFSGWRADRAAAGGILHHQAIHGMALVHRSVGLGDYRSCSATPVFEHSRPGFPSEDRVECFIPLFGGAEFRIDARVDARGLPEHQLTYIYSGGRLPAPVGGELSFFRIDLQSTEAHARSRAKMLKCALAAPATQRDQLFRLDELPPLLGWIEVLDTGGVRS